MKGGSRERKNRGKPGAKRARRFAIAALQSLLGIACPVPAARNAPCWLRICVAGVWKERLFPLPGEAALAAQAETRKTGWRDEARFEITPHRDEPPGAGNAPRWVGVAHADGLIWKWETDSGESAI